MRLAITVVLFAMVLSSCAAAPSAQADKKQLSPAPPSPTPQQNFSPAQQQFQDVFDKAIKDGHVNNVCHDMKGEWETVVGAEDFKVCRLEGGFTEAGPGYVWVLRAWRNSEGGGVLVPAMFDCVGRRSFRNQDVIYDSAGKIRLHTPLALGGEWISIKPHTNEEVVWVTVCKGATK